MIDGRNERRPTELPLADLEQIRTMARMLDIDSSADDFDLGLTTDGIQPSRQRCTPGTGR